MNKTIRTNRRLLSLTIMSIFFIPWTCYASQQQDSKSKTQAAKLEKAELGSTKNLHVCGDLFLAGQFSNDDIATIKSAGIGTVITLRTDGEIKWDEKAGLEQSGIAFSKIPFRAPDTLTDSVFDDVRKQLIEAEGKKTMLHCGSANRVGAVWLAYRVLDQGVAFDTAFKEAKEVGLKSSGYEARAKAYIQKHLKSQKEKGGASKEQSVRPGINDGFLAPNMNVDDWVAKFEVESREIFIARNEIVRSCQIKQGERIADVGAGTGLYTQLFARTTGPKGWVYAVDIAPKFLSHINKEVESKGLPNVTAVLSKSKSITLPENSVDLIFICDTYHHFEFPGSTLESIKSALKPNGRLIVIDFEKIEGKTRPWVMGHVRADKSQVTQEIQAAGFKLQQEVDVPGLDENYFLRFVKN